MSLRKAKFLIIFGLITIERWEKLNDCILRNYISVILSQNVCTLFNQSCIGKLSLTYRALRCFLSEHFARTLFERSEKNFVVSVAE